MTNHKIEKLRLDYDQDPQIFNLTLKINELVDAVNSILAVLPKKGQS